MAIICSVWGKMQQVNVYQELLVCDLHTLEDYCEKAHGHVFVSYALDIFFFFF